MDYTTLASQESIIKTVAALTANNFESITAKNGAEALEIIKQRIPKGASVMNGSSTTLKQIGFIEYLKSGEHGWDNLHAAILKEEDKEKQSLLRKQSVLSDYYVGSVHALSDTGELVIASNTGSQLPHVVFTSPNLIFIVSTKKITSGIAAAFDRLNSHVVPLEDKRLMGEHNMHTMHSKTVILHKENPMMGRKVLIVLVEEDLGF